MKIMLIGEAPSPTDVLEGQPFVGANGRILDGLLRDAGIKREECYLTNIMHIPPPSNDFGKFYLDSARNRPMPELAQGIMRLYEEIKTVNPNCIIALGEEPLKAITGLKSISKWRGSVVLGTTGHKVIPAYHPAVIGREWKFRPPSLADFHRAKKESAYPEIKVTPRTYAVPKLYFEAIKILNQIKLEAKNVAFDIETNAEEITAISFAPDSRPDWAVSIPFCFKGKRYWTQEEDIAIWDAIREILTDDGIGKFAHNGAYDIEFIERTVGFRVRGFVLDTMLAAHALYLELPKGLDFWVSILTDHPYYKDQLHSEDAEAYFKYNATDACLTMEIGLKFRAQLQKENLWEFYQNYLHALWEPLMEMQIRGVKFDYLKRNSVKKRFQEEIAVLQRNLDAAVGHPLNVNSPKQLKEWLYGNNGGLALKEKTKKRKATGEITIAADEEALQALYKESGAEAINTVLKIREKQKILSTYLEVNLDEDKRIRCSYLIIGTETGRLSSRSTINGTGTNLQNIPAGVVRSLFVPDEGKVFVNADLSQAEARVVAYLANDTRLIRIFEEGGDIHRKNAANIFGINESEVSDHQRQLAKRVVHASNYGMGPITFAKTAGIPAADAKRLLNQYFATYPGLANWQESIKAELRRKRYLITPFGRKRIFYNRWEESLFKEGLAYIPQSTVADVVGQGLVTLWKSSSEVPGLETLLQVHDSILVQTPKESIDSTVRLLQRSLSVPVKINGKTLTIPVDIKVGPNWEELSKWPSS